LPLPAIVEIADAKARRFVVAYGFDVARRDVLVLYPEHGEERVGWHAFERAWGEERLMVVAMPANRE